jgi:hypothetical protein
LCNVFGNAFAQVDESKNYLYLYSDSVIYGNNIIYESWLDGSPHFIVDSKRIHPEQVKFFQTGMGFFANTRDLDIAGRTSFSERIRQGKINLFEKQIKDYPEHHYSRYSNPQEESSIAALNYYNIGFGNLKKANYSNLKTDLAGHPASMTQLKEYGRVQRLSKRLFLAGGTAILGGFVSFIANGTKGTPEGFPSPGWSDNVPRPKLGLSLGLIVGGSGLIIGGLFTSLSKPKYLKRAIDAYNYAQ